MALNYQDLDFLINSLDQLIAAKQMKTGEICSTPKYSTDMYPVFEDYPYGHINSVESFLSPPQGRCDPYWAIYEKGYVDYDYFDYGAFSQDFQFFQSQPVMTPQTVSSNQGISLEEIVNSIATNTCQFHQERLQFQEEIKVRFKNMESQISQIISSVSPLEFQSSKNSERSTSNYTFDEVIIEQIADESLQYQSDHQIGFTNDIPNALVMNFLSSESITESVKEEKENEILESFGNLEVSILPSDIFEQVSPIVEFHADFCSNTLRRDDKIDVGKILSTIFFRTLRHKCYEPQFHYFEKNFMIPIGGTVNDRKGIG